MSSAFTVAGQRSHDRNFNAKTFGCRNSETLQYNQHTQVYMCRAILFLFLVKKSFSSPLQVAELPKTDALVKYRRTENVTFCNIVFLHGRFVVFEVLDVGAMNGEVVKGPFYSIVRTVLKSFIADEALCCPAFRSVASCVPS